MTKIRISSIPGLNGEYELAEYPFTRREWREIKLNTGLRPLEFDEAQEKGDQDVVAAMLWVTLTRAGLNSRLIWRELDEVDMYTVIENVEEKAVAAEGDAGPPEQTVSGNVIELDNVNRLDSSGRTTTPSSETSESPLSVTGTPV